MQSYDSLDRLDEEKFNLNEAQQDYAHNKALEMFFDAIENKRVTKEGYEQLHKNLQSEIAADFPGITEATFKALTDSVWRRIKYFSDLKREGKLAEDRKDLADFQVRRRFPKPTVNPSVASDLASGQVIDAAQGFGHKAGRVIDLRSPSQYNVSTKAETGNPGLSNDMARKLNSEMAAVRADVPRRMQLEAEMEQTRQNIEMVLSAIGAEKNLSAEINGKLNEIVSRMANQYNWLTRMAKAYEAMLLEQSLQNASLSQRFWGNFRLLYAEIIHQAPDFNIYQSLHQEQAILEQNIMELEKRIKVDVLGIDLNIEPIEDNQNAQTAFNPNNIQLSELYKRYTRLNSRLAYLQNLMARYGAHSTGKISVFDQMLQQQQAQKAAQERAMAEIYQRQANLARRSPAEKEMLFWHEFGDEVTMIRQWQVNLPQVAAESRAAYVRQTTSDYERFQDLKRRVAEFEANYGIRGLVEILDRELGILVTLPENDPALQMASNNLAAVQREMAVLSRSRHPAPAPAIQNPAVGPNQGQPPAPAAGTTAPQNVPTGVTQPAITPASNRPATPRNQLPFGTFMAGTPSPAPAPVAPALTPSTPAPAAAPTHFIPNWENPSLNLPPLVVNLQTPGPVTVPAPAPASAPAPAATVSPAPAAPLTPPPAAAGSPTPPPPPAAPAVRPTPSAPAVAAAPAAPAAPAGAPPPPPPTPPTPPVLTSTPQLQSVPRTAIAAAPPASPPPPPTVPPLTPSKKETKEVLGEPEILFIGDLNGSLEALRNNLVSLKVISIGPDDQWTWIAGNRKLILLGDIMADRVTEGLQIMSRLADLRKQAEKSFGSLTTIFGNHEDFALSYLTQRPAFGSASDRLNAGFNWMFLWKGQQGRGVVEFIKQYTKFGKQTDLSADLLADAIAFGTLSSDVIDEIAGAGPEALSNMKSDPVGLRILEEFSRMQLLHLDGNTLVLHGELTEEILDELLKDDNVANSVATINDEFSGTLKELLLEDKVKTGYPRFTELSKKFLNPDLIRDFAQKLNNPENGPRIRQKLAELNAMGITLIVHGHTYKTAQRIYSASGITFANVDFGAGHPNIKDPEVRSVAYLDAQRNLHFGKEEAEKISEYRELFTHRVSAAISGNVPVLDKQPPQPEQSLEEITRSTRDVMLNKFALSEGHTDALIAYLEARFAGKEAVLTGYFSLINQYDDVLGFFFTKKHLGQDFKKKLQSHKALILNFSADKPVEDAALQGFMDILNNPYLLQEIQEFINNRGMEELVAEISQVKGPILNWIKTKLKNSN